MTANERSTLCRVDVPAELRIGQVAVPCRVVSLSENGVDLDIDDTFGAMTRAAAEAVVVIPSLGQYKARQLRQVGRRAAYTFDLTEFSRRALGALIADRFPD